MAENSVQPIDPQEAAHLIEALDAYQSQLYPPESNHLDSIDTLRAGNVSMLAVLDNGIPVAMGAIKFYKQYGEIKRVFVSPSHRGRGLAKQIMAALEATALAKGLNMVQLETGIHQWEAIGLYRQLGYAEGKAFGDYSADPLSVFMQKRLLPDKAAN